MCIITIMRSSLHQRSAFNPGRIAVSEPRSVHRVIHPSPRHHPPLQLDRTGTFLRLMCLHYLSTSLTPESIGGQYNPRLQALLISLLCRARHALISNSEIWVSLIDWKKIMNPRDQQAQNQWDIQVRSTMAPTSITEEHALLTFRSHPLLFLKTMDLRKSLRHHFPRQKNNNITRSLRQKSQ